MKMHGSPKDPIKFGLEKIKDSIFKSKVNNSIYKERNLYNTVGFGQETGYEKLPELSFDDLIELALKSDSKTYSFIYI